MRIEKQRAVELRADGMSYSLISSQLGVNKSTLSNWLKDLPYTPNEQVLSRIKHGQGVHGLRRRQIRIDEISELKSQGIAEVGEVSKRDLWMIGLGLWIGEGSKTMEQIRLVNSDPRVVSLFIDWLREICELQDENITIAMHLYPDSDELLSMEYWMNITKLPKEQFRKTQIDRRLDKKIQKLGKTPHGTLHITVASNNNPEKGVRLYRRMMGWISGVTK
ncbi:MAG: helix-turn-helix domain-containing protein [Candidatus Saccharibacteria bacterium]